MQTVVLRKQDAVNDGKGLQARRRKRKRKMMMTKMKTRRGQKTPMIAQMKTVTIMKKRAKVNPKAMKRICRVSDVFGTRL